MTKFESAWVDTYFNSGVDIANRRVFLGDIDAQSVDKAVRGLYLMETECDQQPCEMFISSYGGDIYEALALYDIMNTLQCPIHTFAYGKCMSAAPLLLAAGSKGNRWVSPNVFLMHHDWSAEVDGKGQSLQETVRHYTKLNARWIALLSAHSNKNIKWWTSRAVKSNDFYFDANEAIEWGLADNIWDEN